MAVSDVLVVGGGINGVCIAYNLAKMGAKVQLLEKNFIASGPTGYSSAVIRTHYSNPVTARMALRSLRVWENFAEMVGGESGFTRTGFLVLVRPQDVDGLRSNITMQQAIGINTRFVSIAELQELEPQASLEGLGGAALEPDSGYCEPNTAANSFAQAARKAGAQIETGVCATGVRMEKGKLAGLETNQGFYPAGNVVFASGPWTANLLRPLGVDFPSVIARIKVGLFQPPPTYQHQRIVADFVNQIYMRPETGGFMLVGLISAEEISDRVADPDHFSDRVDRDTLMDFGDRTIQRYPVMEHGSLGRDFASLYDVTPDWHSIIDAVPGCPGLFVCAGTSGHGFKLAPAVGEMTAQMVLDGKRPEDDINLFSIDRFSTGRLVRGQYEYSIIG